ncbi:MAG: LysR family transcriptional regulator [Synergistaceae bacterium]|nr:LysR family transcriptional regulator [Synergistaceae bacterium]
MTLRHLQIFLAVVRCGGMSDAAKELYISQSAVSQAIAEIESMYDVKLFDRLSKKLYITWAGERLFDCASPLVGLYDRMEEVMRSPSVRRLRLGATLTVGTCIFSDIVTMYKKIQPEVDIRVVVQNTKEIQRELLSGELDLALVEGTIDAAELIYEPVIRDRLVLVSGPDSPLTEKESVDLSYLHKKPVILREKGSGTRESFEQVMAANGYEIDCVWVCHNTDAIKNAVIDGHGLTVISYRLVQREISSGVMHACPITDYTGDRSFALVYHRDKNISPWFMDFMRICREYEETSDFDGRLQNRREETECSTKRSKNGLPR